MHSLGQFILLVSKCNAPAVTHSKEAYILFPTVNPVHVCSQMGYRPDHSWQQYCYLSHFYVSMQLMDDAISAAGLMESAVKFFQHRTLRFEGPLQPSRVLYTSLIHFSRKTGLLGNVKTLFYCQLGYNNSLQRSTSHFHQAFTGSPSRRHA